ncbi:hypothetical protein KKC91_02850 [bacterium]|nr:hypothetical protein [bacterium]
MAKLFCLLNNYNSNTEELAINSLDYNTEWQKNVYRDKNLLLGCFELPFKRKDEFWLEHEDVILVLDGEIFSWSGSVEGKTTMDKLLRLFREKGEGLVNFINGNFTLIIWNKKQKNLSIMNDRMGLRPLYYAQYKNKIFFASEIKAIISDPDFEKKLNIKGVVDFFSYEYVLGDKTLVAGINIFPYASTVVLSLDENNLNFKRYWDFNFKEDSFYSENDYLFKFKEITNQAVKRMTKDELKVGIPLSGGLDSRIILAIMEKKERPLYTFTFGEKGSEDERYAKQISKKIKSLHHYVRIKYEYLIDFIRRGVFYCDGLVSCNHYNILNISDEMKQHVDIALDGYLGGVLPRSMYTHCQGKDKSVVFSSFDTFKEDLRRRIFSKDLNKEIELGKDKFFALWQDIKIKEKHNPLNYLNLTQRQRRFINYGKIIMRNFLETRMPFTDYDYMDFCIQMPEKLKTNDIICKKLLVKYFSSMAKIRQQGKGLSLNANRFEKAIHWRLELLKDKMRIVSKKTCNYEKWYRTILKDFVSSILLSQRFKNRQMFNYQEVEKLLNEHFQGKSNYEIQIGVLLTFELWNRFFLDGESKVFYKDRGNL